MIVVWVYLRQFQRPLALRLVPVKGLATLSAQCCRRDGAQSYEMMCRLTEAFTFDDHSFRFVLRNRRQKLRPEAKLGNYLSFDKPA